MDLWGISRSSSGRGDCEVGVGEFKTLSLKYCPKGTGKADESRLSPTLSKKGVQAKPVDSQRRT